MRHAITFKDQKCALEPAHSGRSALIVDSLLNAFVTVDSNM